MAQSQSVSVEQLVQNILAAALEKRSVDRLFSLMQSHAREQKLSPEDVEPAIAEYRTTKTYGR